MIAEPIMSLYDCKGGITDIEINSDVSKSDLRLRFIELRAKGYSYAKISQAIGVSKATLSNWSQELEEEIASLKAIELEALQEEYFLLKEHRIRVLGDQIKAIRSELESRSLEDVPAEKLLELLLKYQAALKEEFVETRPLSSSEIAELKALKSPLR